jgi:hypothetical protein
METTSIIVVRINVLIKALVDSYNQAGYRGSCAYNIETGRKYHKVIHIESGGGRSVHAFVDRETGSVYKPASWRAPAKGVRYNLLDDQSYQTCIDRADWAGGYLYVR